MKKGLVASLGFISLIGHLMAQEIDSRVIHNYRYVGIGYQYFHDLADLDFDAHGVYGQFSFETRNLLFSVEGVAGRAVDPGFVEDLGIGRVKPRVGYVARLFDNHLNIIPAVAGQWLHLEADDPVLGSDSEDSWSIMPGVLLSYALNDHIAVFGGYEWAYNFDFDEDDHVFTGGAKLAIMDQIGLSLAANLSAETGFDGIIAAAHFHY